MRKDLINEAIIELTRFYSLSSKQADVFLDRLKSTENSSINELIELQYMINMYYGYWYAISVRDWKIAESYSCCLEGYLEGNRNKNVIIEAFYPKYLRDFLLECTNEEENILDFNVEGNGLVQDSKSLIDANEIKRIKSKIFNKSLFNQFIIAIKASIKADKNNKNLGISDALYGLYILVCQKLSKIEYSKDLEFLSPLIYSTVLNGATLPIAFFRVSKSQSPQLFFGGRIDNIQGWRW